MSSKGINEVSIKEIARLFLKLGFIGFGGPAAHIAMMQNEVVSKRNWMSEQHFLDLLGATNLIPRTQQYRNGNTYRLRQRRLERIDGSRIVLHFTSCFHYRDFCMALQNVRNIARNSTLDLRHQTRHYCNHYRSSLSFGQKINQIIFSCIRREFCAGFVFIRHQRNLSDVRSRITGIGFFLH